MMTYMNNAMFKNDKYTNRNLIFIFIIYSMLNSCCKNEPDCTSSHETKASFNGYNTSNLELWKQINYPLIENDTNWSHMTFVADDIADATYYKWIIGAEEIENTPIVFRQGFPLNMPVSIQLVVKKSPNKICFPNDDGIDTLTKTYYFTDKERRWYRPDGSYLYFRGSFTHKPKDSFTIYFSADKDKRLNRMDTIFDFPCKGSKIMHFLGQNKYNSFEGQANVDGNKFVCDTMYRFYFSYLRNGNGIYIKATRKEFKDSMIFMGYQIK